MAPSSFDLTKKRVGRPTRFGHKEVRHALLSAASEILEVVDVSDFSLRECARRAGVSYGAPAHHFLGKTGLLTELAAESFDALGRAIDRRLMKASDDPADQFRAAATAYIDYAVHNKARFQLMYRAEVIDQQSPRLRGAFEACHRRIYGTMSTLLGSGTRRLDERTVVRFAMAWSIIHGFAVLAQQQERYSLLGLSMSGQKDGSRKATGLSVKMIDEMINRIEKHKAEEQKL